MSNATGRQWPEAFALAERMAFLNATQGEGAGREYYTNLCMKAVNQSVGRAIRDKLMNEINFINV